MAKRSYTMGADRGKRLNIARGFRRAASLPVMREMEVYCPCGHRGVVQIARDAMPSLKCSKCGERGLVSEFIRPLGRQI
jgi:hypothetical protein